MTGAIDYVMNNKEGLMRFIEYGDAPMSNQTAEQSIRPFVVIRNRCRFHFSMAGADVSAMLYSLMITARENDATLMAISNTFLRSCQEWIQKMRKD